MTYVCSDLHGNYDRYMDFLDSVNFSNEDTLYIIGDVLDRGENAVELLRDIMQRKNVILLKGNHELMLIPTLDELSYTTDKFEQIAIIEDECAISQIGQEDTLKDFLGVKSKEQIEMVNFLKDLPLYKQITVQNQKYLLVHAGLPDFSNMDLDFYSEEELLFGVHDYSEKHFDETITIVGHLPTRFISGAEPDQIYREGDSINVDCGAGFGGQLGVLCLETNEEFYF